MTLLVRVLLAISEEKVQEMRRALMVVLGISMLVLLAATPVSAGVDDGRAEVIHGSWRCARSHIILNNTDYQT